MCSKSTLGKRLLDAPRHQHAFAKIGALASALGIPAEDILDSGQANEQQAAMILSGYSLGTMRNFVKRSEIADHLSRMDEQLVRVATIVDQAEQEREEVVKRGNTVCGELEQQHATRQKTWTEFHNTAELTWTGIRRAFQEQLHLQAPATYWKERAEKTSAEARRFLTIFVVSAITLIFLIVLLGPKLLERLGGSRTSGTSLPWRCCPSRR